MSYQAFRLLPATVRIMMQDHGTLDSDEMANQAMTELDAEGRRPIWVFDSVVARKD